MLIPRCKGDAAGEGATIGIARGSRALAPGCRSRWPRRCRSNRGVLYGDFERLIQTSEMLLYAVMVRINPSGNS